MASRMMSLQVQARIYRPWKMMRAACLLFWLTALAARAEPPSIDNANFGEVVTASRQPFVIEFYSEMCGSCKEFAPTWHAFAARLESVAGLGLGRVCVDKPPGVKLASSLDGLFDAGIPQVRRPRARRRRRAARRGARAFCSRAPAAAVSRRGAGRVLPQRAGQAEGVRHARGQERAGAGLVARRRVFGGPPRRGAVARVADLSRRGGGETAADSKTQTSH